MTPTQREAADEIERLRTELANVNNEFGSQTADWPDAWKRVAELKQLSNDRWREAERLRAALAELLACHTESAGWSMSMLTNRAEFDEMIDRNQERLESAVGAARAALKEKP